MTGRTIMSGNGLQENLAKSVTCRFCHSDVTLLENVSARSGLGLGSITSRCSGIEPKRRKSSLDLDRRVS